MPSFEDVGRGATKFRHHQPEIYGLHHPIGQGYGVQHGHIHPKQRGGNGRMVNQIGEEIYFYIEDTTAKFEMIGSTAQSRRVRQFFPHNMAQPSITVTGMAPSSYEYNRLANFIRASHIYGISGRKFAATGTPVRTAKTTAGRNIFLPTVVLYILDSTPYSGKKSGKRNGVKGKHRPWKLEGYVKSIQAGARTGEYAKQFQFEFLIAQSYNNNGKYGIFTDGHLAAREIKTWMQIFEARGQESFVQDPTQEDDE